MKNSSPNQLKYIIFDFTCLLALTLSVLRLVLSLRPAQKLSEYGDNFWIRMPVPYFIRLSLFPNAKLGCR